MQGVAWEQIRLGVYLVQGHLYSWHHPATSVGSSKRHQQLYEEGARRTRRWVWNTRLLVHADIRWRVDMFVRTDIIAGPRI